MANNKSTTKTAPAKAKKGFGYVCKDALRKFIVSLKRRPQRIPLVVFVIAFIIYSFHLSDVSDTTAQLQGSNMGLAGFAVMLLSMLSLLCFNNAFPYRKKVNVPMLVLCFVMVGIIVFADVYYLGRIDAALNSSGSNIDLVKNSFIIYAQWYIQQHIIWLAVGTVLTALLPVYSKLLRKINTNVEVAGNAEMGTLDLSADA